MQVRLISLVIAVVSSFVVVGEDSGLARALAWAKARAEAESRRRARAEVARARMLLAHMPPATRSHIRRIEDPAQRCSLIQSSYGSAGPSYRVATLVHDMLIHPASTRDSLGGAL